MSQKAGQIVAAGTRRDVFFEGVTGPINEHIDRAYRAKYQGSQCLKPMTGERCRSATVRITPDELRPPPPKRVVPGHSHRY